MSVIDLLLDLFRNEESQQDLADDPSGFLAENVPEGLTAAQVLAAMPDVCAALPPEQAESLRTAYGLSAASAAGGGGSAGGQAVGNAPQDGPSGPPPVDPGGDPVEQVLQQLDYYTTVVNTTNQQFEDNDVTNIDDRDTTVDSSVNQNITAFGDVNQDFDNDVVSGDGAVAAGDGSQVNTGAGAVQAGDDIEDSNVVTGSVTDSVLADDIDDSIIGDDNQAIIDSNVGAATFGEGDATNVSAQNANVGDGVQVVGSDDTNVNTGEGDLITIDDSTVEESQLGGEGNTLVSNDVDIDAQDGSAVAFGAGSEADAQQQNVNIEDNYGQVQVAGDDATQTVDQSSTQTITDSYNDQSVNDSYNVTDSGNVDASDDDGLDVDNSLNQNDLSDDDVIDVL
jgi:hypothetical protein